MDINKMSSLLKDLRLEKSLSKKDLSKITQSSIKDINKWENANAIPSIFVLEKLSAFYGIKIEDIINGNKNSIKNIEKKDDKKMKKFNLIFSAVYLYVFLILLVLYLFKITEFSDVFKYLNSNKVIILLLALFASSLILDIILSVLVPKNRIIYVARDILSLLPMVMLASYDISNIYIHHNIELRSNIIAFMMVYCIIIKSKSSYKTTKIKLFLIELQLLTCTLTITYLFHLKISYLVPYLLVMLVVILLKCRFKFFKFIYCCLLIFTIFYSIYFILLTEAFIVMLPILLSTALVVNESLNDKFRWA